MDENKKLALFGLMEKAEARYEVEGKLLDEICKWHEDEYDFEADESPLWRAYYCVEGLKDALLALNIFDEYKSYMGRN